MWGDFVMNIQNSLCRGGGNCVWLGAVLLVSPMGKYRITPVGDKEFCFAFGGCIGFTNGEYRIASVDFIAPCGVAPEPTRLAKDEGSALHPS